MNNKKIMEIKKEYRKQNGKEQLEQIYYRGIDTVSDKFETAFDMLNKILDSANEILSVEEKDLVSVSRLYIEYRKFYSYFSNVLHEVDEMRACKYMYFEEYIRTYKKMYYRIISSRLGKGVSKKERDVYASVLISTEIVRYRRFLSEYINEYINEFTLYHNEVEEALSYIIKKAEKVEDKPEEITEIIKEEVERIQDIQYIAKPKDLEKMAKALGYEYKGCTGSHKKYENIETGKCVIIPYHGSKDVGVGLSRTIQKQLLEGLLA